MSLQEYATLASRHEAFINDKTKWISDKYFTQQRLAGTNPMSLQRVTVHKRGKAGGKCLVPAAGGGGSGVEWRGWWSKKFYTGGHCPEVQPLTLLYSIFDRKGTPFVGNFFKKSNLELRIPFKCCECSVLKLWINPKTMTFCRSFQGRKTHMLAHFYRKKWQISLPFYILQWVKSLPFLIPEAWRGYPFRAEPRRLGHYR